MRPKQQEIIYDLEVKPAINPIGEIEARSGFLAAYLAHTGLNGFVLGISGGQDSLLAGLLAKRAVDIRREQGANAAFHAVLLPYGSQADRADAELACQFIAPDVVHDLDIKPATDSLTASYAMSEHHPLPDYHKGNVKARMRMIAQYALAGDYGLLVIGTDHAGEAVTGFFTKFGDGGSDVLPLNGLTKSQGRAMLQELGAPEVFVTKQPTADLLDAAPGRSDEAELQLSYIDIDAYLTGHAVDDHTAEMIEARYDMSWHKRVMPVAYHSPRNMI